MASTSTNTSLRTRTSSSKGKRSSKGRSKTATVNTRIDARLKAEAEGVLRELQLTPTTAVRMLYKLLVFRRGLPFDVVIPNAVTIAALEEAERGRGKAYRGSSRAIIKAMLHDAE
jgi:DNA-damage-inducible protein J